MCVNAPQLPELALSAGETKGGKEIAALARVLRYCGTAVSLLNAKEYLATASVCQPQCGPKTRRRFEEMNPDLDTLQIQEAMSPVTVTVTQTQKIGDVARLFQENKINSAPVIDESGRCVGIITSGDLVRFQSQLADAGARIDHGLSFELSQREPGGSLEIVQHPFDEAGRHMTSEVQTVDKATSLVQASKIMCSQGVHHLIVLDDAEHPIGILSSLDILKKLHDG